MSVSTKGFCENVLTLKAASGLKAGVPVAVSANDTVSAAGADAKFCGVSVNVNGGYAGVQLSGVVTMPYTGYGRPGGRLCGSRIGRRGWSQGEHKGQHISRAQRQHNRQNSELHALILKGE